ncbi:MAG TPA: hypothetical protein VEU47_04025 [Candidatus Cybelea sp.]|nr:hypothetical protein [Candidatus Cybelea sp.]
MTDVQALTSNFVRKPPYDEARRRVLGLELQPDVIITSVPLAVSSSGVSYGATVDAVSGINGVPAFGWRAGDADPSDVLTFGLGEGTTVAERCPDDLTRFGMSGALTASFGGQVLVLCPPSNRTAQSARFYSQLQRYKAALAGWSARLPPMTYFVLERHLAAIFGDVDEVISAQSGSFDEILSYLASHRYLKPPSMQLRRDGIFSIAWSPGGKARITLEFLGDGKVRCIAVDARPSVRRPIRGAFELPVWSLDSFIASVACDAWMRA